MVGGLLLHLVELLPLAPLLGRGAADGDISKARERALVLVELFFEVLGSRRHRAPGIAQDEDAGAGCAVVRAQIRLGNALRLRPEQFLRPLGEEYLYKIEGKIVWS